MGRLRRPRWRWWGWLLAGFGVLVLYLLALSVIPALLGGGGAKVDQARARRSIAAENWSLVLPEEREELGRAVDEAWRSLTAYRFSYRAGTPADLAADQPLVASDSVFNLGNDGRIREQHDTNYTSAAAAGSDGHEQRFEGYRVLTDRPYVNSRNQRVGDTELIYQHMGGAWSCQRVLADKTPGPPPGLRFTEAGDGGFSEIDGNRVRAFTLPEGAFGLRSPATIWIDVEALRVRRQEIQSALHGQHEVWTYSGFNEPNAITPPSGIACSDS
jgi:hypothetical protein